MEFVYQPSSSKRLGDRLQESLSGPWAQFRAAVAFVKRSGTKHIVASLASFAQSHDVEIIVGVDHGGSSSEGLSDLLDAVSPNGRVIVFHNNLPFTFHPKIFLFKSSEAAEILIGSGNLTEGGLFTNYEAGLHFRLDLSKPGDATFVEVVEDVLNSWADTSTGTALDLDYELLSRLTAMGLTPSEALAESASEDEQSKDMPDVESDSEDVLFASRMEHRAPTVPSIDDLTELLEIDPSEQGVFPPQDSGGEPSKTGFVMILQRTDVGIGQTSRGTSRRSPEIFIPLAAREEDPDFWGWPERFVPDPKKPGKFDRRGVRIRLGEKVIGMNMMTWPDKRDFRLRSEELRSAGSVGDILRIERVNPLTGHEYDVEVIASETTRHSEYLDHCSRKVRNSKKRFGYY